LQNPRRHLLGGELQRRIEPGDLQPHVLPVRFDRAPGQVSPMIRRIRSRVRSLCCAIAS
jgi:hypothetical protein